MVPEADLRLQYQIHHDESRFVNISSVRDCGHEAADLIFRAIAAGVYNRFDHPPWNATERVCENVKYNAYLRVGFHQGTEDRIDWMQLAQIFQALAAAVQKPYWYNFHCVIYIFKETTLWSLAAQYPKRGEDPLLDVAPLAVSI